MTFYTCPFEHLRIQTVDRNRKCYLIPHFSSELKAAMTAPAMAARTPGMPCRLCTPHVSWMRNFRSRKPYIPEIKCTSITMQYESF